MTRPATVFLSHFLSSNAPVYKLVAVIRIRQRSARATVGDRVSIVGVQAQLDEQRKRELQSVIQAHFKEWLLSSGNMRQVWAASRTPAAAVAFDSPACFEALLNVSAGRAQPMPRCNCFLSRSTVQPAISWLHLESHLLFLQVYDLARMEREDPGGPDMGDRPPL